MINNCAQHINLQKKRFLSETCQIIAVCVEWTSSHGSLMKISSVNERRSRVTGGGGGGGGADEKQHNKTLQGSWRTQSDLRKTDYTHINAGTQATGTIPVRPSNTIATM